MQLKSISYVERQGEPGEWTIKDLRLRDQNLIVGVNASGKSKTLLCVYQLARLVSGVMKPEHVNGQWEAHFDHDGEQIIYELTIKNSQVEHESFIRGGTRLLERSTGGEGTIQTTTSGPLSFQSPQTELAVVTRRDAVQHAFLAPLHQWGQDLYFLPCSGDLGQTEIMLTSPNVPPRTAGQDRQLETRDGTQTNWILQRGLLNPKIRSLFQTSIKQDLERLNYQIDDVDMEAFQISPRPGMVPPDAIPIRLYLKEHDLQIRTNAFIMSRGMYRALALIVHLNYAALMPGYTNCVLVDDIGEGLDYGRSRELIKVVRERVDAAHIQLVMSTNDRFTMNDVPLEDWTVLRRTGGTVKVYNYENSQETFDRFKATGFSNFDFFAFDYLAPSGEERQ